MTKADYKVIVVGPSDAGKTALMDRFVNNSFRVEKQTTVGVSFLIRSWHNIHLAIWDTCGQEKFAPLTQFYARDAAAAIIAFDMTDREGFDNITTWVNYLTENAKGCVKVLVGCKVDLCNDAPATRAVSKVEGVGKAEDIGAVAYIETSAKTGEKVESVFDEICEKLRPGTLQTSTSSSSSQPQTKAFPTISQVNKNKDTVVISKKNEEEKKGCCDK
eukprot:m.20945 g.20945  ORF g.20945 m.20945 type:complete len:217 (-) comp8646_c0_seq1:99-749(-)